VVKKKILKLLKADIIYRISDSAWVSPIDVVPKKVVMTVIKTENSELILLGLSRAGACALITRN